MWDRSSPKSPREGWAAQDWGGGNPWEQGSGQSPPLSCTAWGGASSPPNLPPETPWGERRRQGEWGGVASYDRWRRGGHSHTHPESRPRSLRPSPGMRKALLRLRLGPGGTKGGAFQENQGALGQGAYQGRCCLVGGHLRSRAESRASPRSHTWAPCLHLGRGREGAPGDPRIVWLRFSGRWAEEMRGCIPAFAVPTPPRERVKDGASALPTWGSTKRVL